jgi:hypothetical protein
VELPIIVASVGRVSVATVDGSGGITTAGGSVGSSVEPDPPFELEQPLNITGVVTNDIIRSKLKSIEWEALPPAAKRFILCPFYEGSTILVISAVH